MSGLQKIKQFHIHLQLVVAVAYRLNYNHISSIKSYIPRLGFIIQISVRAITPGYLMSHYYHFVTLLNFTLLYSEKSFKKYDVELGVISDRF